MDTERGRFLVSAAALQALHQAQNQLAGLSLHARVDRLRKSFPANEAAALSEQIELRARAEEKLGALAKDWLFSRGGLEMATHPLVARRRAQRFATMDVPVADLTCGIGSDLYAFSESCERVTGLERDAPTALLAAHNTGGRALVAVGDALRPPLGLSRMAIMLDPSRRAGPLRRFNPAAFSPPWDACLALLDEAAAGALKGPPGISDGAIPPDTEVEFVQLGRSLREACLYAGGFAKPGLRRAVLLASGDELCSGDPQSSPTVAPIGAILYDPEPCVTRAGLVRQLAHQLEATVIEPRLAYLSGGTAMETPFAATFEVLDVVPFSLARLKQRLREAGQVAYEIRRRAFPIEPDDLRRQLGRMEGQPVTLLCTTVAGRRIVVVARRLDKNTAKNAKVGRQ